MVITQALWEMCLHYWIVSSVLVIIFYMKEKNFDTKLKDIYQYLDMMQLQFIRN